MYRKYNGLPSPTESVSYKKEYILTFLDSFFSYHNTPLPTPKKESQCISFTFIKTIDPYTDLNSYIYIV